MLYGDVDRMLAPCLDRTADLVIAGTAKTDGFLTVLRNAPRTNELAIGDPAYKDVLASHEHWASDETSWRWGSQISSFTKIVKEAEARGELSIRWGIQRVTVWRRETGGYVTMAAPSTRTTATKCSTTTGDLCDTAWCSGRVAKRRKSGFAFDRYGFYDPKSGRAQLAVRRAEGRVRELASDARRRLSKWRAAVRATISAPGSLPGGD